MDHKAKEHTEQLERLRVNAKFTHAKVADHLGITQQYWYQIRTGIKPLSETVLKKIKELNVRLRGFSQAS